MKPLIRLMIATVPTFQRLGSEFMPSLNEGSSLYMPTTLPGISVGQAEALGTMMNGRGALVVLHMVVPADVLVDRLHSRRICSVCGANADPSAPEARTCGQCGGELVQRTDDGEAVVRNRLQVYDQQTRPLVAYYRSSPTFVEIDANRVPDQVAEAMKVAIDQTLEAAEDRRS